MFMFYNIALVIFVVMFVFAIIGWFLFYDLPFSENSSDTINRIGNWRSFLNSLFMTLRFVISSTYNLPASLTNLK
jgi:cell shape-determining protein MreC